MSEDKGWFSGESSEGHVSRDKGLSDASAPTADPEQAPPAEPASNEGWFGETPAPGHASQDKAVGEPEPAVTAAAVENEPPPPPAPQTYTVVSGDTLWAISERFYGDGNQYQRIADASGVSNPDLIYPGQVLTIP